MTLRVGKRFRILGADLDYSNITLASDASDWNSGTAYVVGDRVRREQSGASVLGVWRIFECIQAHTNKNPNLRRNQNTYWVLVSHASRFIPFDDAVGLTPTTALGEYFWRLSPTSVIVQYIGVFNAAGNTLLITQLQNAFAGLTLNDDSEAFQATGNWTTAQANVTADTHADPLIGVIQADSLFEDSTASSVHGLNAVQSITWTSGLAYNATFYVRRGSGTRNVQWTFPSARFGAGVGGQFTLSGAGSVTNLGGATCAITDVGGGWYRISATATCNSTGTAALGFIRMLSGSSDTYNGNGTSSLILFGFNLIQASAAANYVVKINGGAFIRRLVKSHTFTYSSTLYPGAQPYNPNIIAAVNQTFAPSARYEVQITAKTPTDTQPRIGEIVFVYDVEDLGVLIQPLDENLLDFSVKNRDDFGNVSLIPRSVADDINYTFAMSKTDRGRVKSILKDRRGQPLVVFDDDDLDNELDIISFCFLQGYSMPVLPADVQIVSLDTEGLT
jgi:hypothetical protein